MTTSPAESSHSRISVEPYLSVCVCVCVCERERERCEIQLCCVVVVSSAHQNPRAKVLNMMK